MSGFDEYGKHDAVSLASLVNSGEINETKLLDEALSRMRAIQPELNAVLNGNVLLIRSFETWPTRKGFI